LSILVLSLAKMLGFYTDASYTTYLVLTDQIVGVEEAWDVTIEQHGIYSNGRRGVFKEDTIVWDDGAKWHRVLISARQLSVFRRRPPLFLSILFVTGVWRFVMWTLSGARRVLRR
jgi:hypothetical protein